MSTIAACPIWVIEACRRPVWEALKDLQSAVYLIQRVNNIIPDMLDIVVDSIVKDANEVVDLIPNPPLLPDLSIFLCPLLPVLFTTGDWVKLKDSDPAVFLQQTRAFSNNAVGMYRVKFQEALEVSTHWPVLQVVQRYVQDLRSLRVDHKRVAHATGIALYVKRVAPSEYRAGPYQKLLELADPDTFKLLNNVPNTANQSLMKLMTPLMRAELKLDLWKAFANQRILP